MQSLKYKEYKIASKIYKYDMDTKELTYLQLDHGINSENKETVDCEDYVIENTINKIKKESEELDKIKAEMLTHECDIPDIKNEYDDFTDFTVEPITVSEELISDEVQAKNYSERIKRYPCPVCGKNFTSLYLKYHMRFHTEVSVYYCEICLKCYSRQGNFKEHMRCHTEEKDFRCKICLKDLKTKENLKIHRRHHNEEKPFKCSVCSKSFSQYCYLNMHLRYHMAEKSFKCKICSRSFSRISSLKLHIHCHGRQKSYKCEICFLDFMAKGDLAKHMRLHTGEKPFQCSICFKMFSRYNYLVIHIRSHAGENDINVNNAQKILQQRVI